MATPTTLPASFSAGNVLTAVQMNDLRGAFRVLQIIYASTTTQASSTSATYATTNLAATITPSATSSKVLILANVQTTSNAAAQYTGLRIFNGTSAILTNNRALMQPAAGDIGAMCSLLYLDSPATTSAITYTIQFARTNGAGTSTVQNNSDPSTIIVCEVSA